MAAEAKFLVLVAAVDPCMVAHRPWLNVSLNIIVTVIERSPHTSSAWLLTSPVSS